MRKLEAVKSAGCALLVAAPVAALLYFCWVVLRIWARGQ